MISPIISSFYSYENLHKLSDFPELLLFQTCDKTWAKRELIKRIQAATQQFPHQFSEIITGVLHPDFEITVYDTELLQDIRDAALFFTKEPSFAPGNNTEHSVASHTFNEQKDKNFWQIAVSELDRLIEEKSALQLLNFPFDVLSQVIAYLPLPDLWCLIRATLTKIKAESNGKTKIHLESPLKEILYDSISVPEIPPASKTTLNSHSWVIQETCISQYPRMIMKAPQSSAIEKSSACLVLSKQWRTTHNRAALSKLFTLLHSPLYREIRGHYLRDITDRSTLLAFLNAECAKDQSLSLNISSLISDPPSHLLTFHSPSLADSLYHPVCWQELLKTYSALEELTIATQLYQQASIQKYIKPVLNKITQFKNIKHLILNIEGLDQPSIPIFIEGQLNAYKECICAFKHIEKLTISTKRQSAHHENNPISAVYQRARMLYMKRQIHCLESKIPKLLDPSLSVATLQVEFNCLSYPSCPSLEDEKTLIRSLKLSVRSLLPLVQSALTSRNFSQIQLIFPKPLLKHLSKEKAEELLYLSPETKIEEDLTWVFRKNQDIE